MTLFNDNKVVKFVKKFQINYTFEYKKENQFIDSKRRLIYSRFYS